MEIFTLSSLQVFMFSFHHSGLRSLLFTPNLHHFYLSQQQFAFASSILIKICLPLPLLLLHPSHQLPSHTFLFLRYSKLTCSCGTLACALFISLTFMTTNPTATPMTAIAAPMRAICLSKLNTNSMKVFLIFTAKENKKFEIQNNQPQSYMDAAMTKMQHPLLITIN